MSEKTKNKYRKQVPEHTGPVNAPGRSRCIQYLRDGDVAWLQSYLKTLDNEGLMQLREEVNKEVKRREGGPQMHA